MENQEAYARAKEYGEFIGEVRTSLMGIEKRLDKGAEDFDELRQSTARMSNELTMLKAKSSGFGFLGGSGATALWEVIKRLIGGS
jgi:ubiquinone biosynthesis protein UbiJ